MWRACSSESSAARAEGAPGPLLRQGVEALRGVGRPPAADRLARDAEQVGDVGFGEAQFAAAKAARRSALRTRYGERLYEYGGKHFGVPLADCRRMAL